MKLSFGMISLLWFGQMGIAAAQVIEPAAAEPVPPQPFITLDRQDGTTSLDLSMDATVLLDEDADAFGLRAEFFGQMTQPTGIGGYGRLPISMLIGDLSEDDHFESALGNIEGGAHYARSLDARTSYVFRGGLTLPTASDEFVGYLTNVINSWARLTDLSLIVPETWWLRLGGSLIFQDQQTFFRFDGGLDAALSSPDGVDPDTLVHVNIGAGIKSGNAVFMLELVTLGSLEGDGDLDERFNHTVALSAGSLDRTTRVGIITPLDEDARGDVIILNLTHRFGGPVAPAAPGLDASSCDERVAAWRAETDLRRKTEIFEAMPPACRATVEH